MANPKSGQHILERRATLLSQRIQQRISDMTLALQAAGGRIPFRAKLSKGDALDWWAKHRYDALGKQALAGLSPLTTLQLDNALAERARNQPQGLPEEAAAAGTGGESEIGGSPNALQ